MSPRWRSLASMGIIVAVVAACSGGGPSAAPSVAGSAAPTAAASPAASEGTTGEPVTVDWWHITTGEPGKSDFQAAADAYMAENPNVTIKVTVLENEAFKTKLSTTAAADYPDLFQSWGGGIMAAQADAGLLKDITADITDWKDTINPGAMSIYAYNGKQYGVPWDMGMIGFWYNKALFEQAGYHGPAGDVGRVPRRRQEAAGRGHRPARDRRQGQVAIHAPVDIPGAPDRRRRRPVRDDPSGNWNTEACTKAGDEVLKLNELDPYQAGYKSADYNAEAASVGNGKAAMELMGQWAPSVQMDQSADKKGLGDDLGWFAFPTVAGGAGAATDGVGGGNGIAVGVNAPPEAIDFLKFFSSVDNGNKLNTDNVGLSTVVGTESSVKDPNLQAVLAGRGDATFMQLYLDQATSGGLSQAFNDATIALFLGESTPGEVCQALTDAAAAG